MEKQPGGCQKITLLALALEELAPLKTEFLTGSE